MLFRSKLDRLIACLGIAGFIVGISLAPHVFPSASVDLSLPRQSVYQQAETYLQDRIVPVTEVEQTATQLAPLGLDLSDYKSVQQFGRDRTTSLYLQRTLGIPETKRLTGEEHLPMYYWSTRWFKPSQEEEFHASFSTTGEVVSFYHTIPEDSPGKNLDEEAAQAIAETYLERDRIWNLDDWELADSSTRERPHRTDHTFNWKKKSFEAAEAELRLSVDIYGDQVGYYSHWVKIPQSYFRDFREERSLVSFFSGIISLISFNAPLVAAFLFFVVGFSRGQINWRSGLPPAVLYFLVIVLARINTLPMSKSGYSTTQNYTLFWIQVVYSSVFYAIAAAVPIYFLWVGGQQIAKKVWPKRDMFLPRSPNRLKAFTRAYWRGMMLGGISMGYVMLFYWVATRWFGSWSPMDVSYSNVLSTPLPFLSPLRSGILPAISEELRARLVGIGVVYWLTRRWWLALALPGGIWAFAHLGYLSDPVYLRGIELWFPAVFLYGLFFLRFGLLTTMVGHCVYNALWGTSVLLKADDPYLIACGVFVIVLFLLPLLPGLMQQWQTVGELDRHRRDNPLDIVPATAEDYALLKRLPLVNCDLRNIFQLGEVSEDYEVVCLKADETIEGVGIANLKTEKSATVQMIYVTPYYRRCYYGTRLVESLTKRLRQRGIRDIQVETITQRPAESRFWANQNWQTTSRKMRFMA